MNDTSGPRKGQPTPSALTGFVSALDGVGKTMYGDEKWEELKAQRVAEAQRKAEAAEKKRKRDRQIAMAFAVPIVLGCIGLVVLFILGVIAGIQALIGVIFS